MPPHLSGASPTTYFCGNAVWQNVLETSKKILEAQRKTSNQEMMVIERIEPIAVINDRLANYSELHQIPFVENVDSRMVVENAPYDQLNRRDHNGNTPLIWAASEGNYQLVELLIDQGAALNLQNFVGETALMIAAARGFEGICSLLIENGGNVNATNLEGASPLHLAAAAGNIGILRLLLSRGAFINSTDDEGDTALHYAVRESQKEIVEFLVKNCGADFTFKNDDAESPLDLASEFGETEILSILTGNPNFGRVQQQTQINETGEYNLFFGEEHDARREEMHQVTDELARTVRSVAIY